jgi:hypothetical protein
MSGLMVCIAGWMYISSWVEPLPSSSKEVSVLLWLFLGGWVCVHMHTHIGGAAEDRV